jgi:hypothetical protein
MWEREGRLKALQAHMGSPQQLEVCTINNKLIPGHA